MLIKSYKKSYGVALREGKITYDFAYETIMFKKELLEYDKPKQYDEKFLDLKATGITGFID